MGPGRAIICEIKLESKKNRRNPIGLEHRSKLRGY